MRCCSYNLGLIVRVMFANFAKIGRAAGASPIWQNFQTSRVPILINTNTQCSLFFYQPSKTNQIKPTGAYLKCNLILCVGCNKTNLYCCHFC